MKGLALAFGLMLAACGPDDEPPVAARETARQLAGGQVIGFVNDDGAHVWRGLPFAAPPVGELRWRAPRPAPGWRGERPALEQAARCPQLANAFTPDIPGGTLIGAEDCLYLNVFAPPMTADEARRARLPVMMWIHGGGNVWGGADQYDPSRLAMAENVIIVSVQYRLGPLGWFAHPVLRDAANQDTPENAIGDDRSANFGTQDLIAALRWIADNAVAMGGDPERVTIFGESAGGHNVASLLAAPTARGLFHRAILQSGSFDSVSMDEAMNGLLPSTEQGARGPNGSLDVWRRLGQTVIYPVAGLPVSDVSDGSETPITPRALNAEGLRATPIEDFFAAYDTDAGSGFMDMPLIIEDGITLPAHPLIEAFDDTETFHDVPILSGTNLEEVKLFQLLDPDYTRRPIGIILKARDKAYYQASSDYMSRLWRLRAVDAPLMRMQNAGHRSVYGYRFDWNNAGRFLVSDFGFLLGAAHAMEIPFIFARFEMFGPLDRFVFRDKTRDERAALAAAMGAYWADFARSGEPVAPAPASDRGLAPWPVFGDGTLMRFDAGTDGPPQIINDRESLERIIDDMRTDPRLTGDERCSLAARIDRSPFAASVRVAHALGCSAPAAANAP